MPRDASVLSASPAAPHRSMATISRALSASFGQVARRIGPRAAMRRPAGEQNVLVINGHPDPRPERYCAALCDAYAAGARTIAGNVRQLSAGNLTFALTAVHAEQGCCPVAGELEDAVETICWADELALVFPLWLDQPPVPLQQLLGIAARRRSDSIAGRRASARGAQHVRAIVTMEMPAFAQRSIFGGRKSEAPHATLWALPGVVLTPPLFIGCVSTISAQQRQRWLENVRTLGQELAGS